MNYRRIINYVASTPWAIHEDKMATLLDVLAFRAAGREFTAEEIRARIGDDQPATPTATQRGAVAVIPLRGVVAHRMSDMQESSGGMSAERFTRMVKAATADPNIGSIVIDVDSPGGTITGLVEAADAVFEARDTKRVVAVANGMMASAAYWIASQASEIVAIPGIFDRFIGSIGVFTVYQNLQKALEQEGIEIEIFRAGENKAEGNPFEPLSDEARARMKASVDAAKAQFVKTVARGRGITPGQVVERYGDGLAFGGKEALAAGLIDRIASFEETVGKLAGRRQGAGMRAEEDAPLLASDDLARRIEL
jgi:signal peptide peptidase SppA